MLMQTKYSSTNTFHRKEKELGTIDKQLDGIGYYMTNSILKEQTSDITSVLHNNALSSEKLLICLLIFSRNLNSAEQ